MVKVLAIQLVFIMLASIAAKGQLSKPDSLDYHDGPYLTGLCDSTITKKRNENKFALKNQIIPATLIISGLILETGTIKEDLQDAFPRTDTEIDNYLQWAPAATMYSADIFTKNHRNNVFNQTKYLAISCLVTSGITQILKKITHETRPNGGDDMSFPSGHSSNAFANATVLFHEFKDFNKIIAGSGYLFATTTGVLRVTNNAHWVPDVLVGAGIGILVTNLVYWIEPFKNWDPFRLSDNDKLTILPNLDTQNNFYCLTVRIKL
jgi:hypothetical protein